MKVQVDILVENTTPRAPLVGEYGFSALLTVDGRKILFDAGSGTALFTNCTHMGIDPGEFEEIIISHGHFDHTGAIMPFLKKYGGRKIYSHPDIFPRRILPGSRSIIDIGCSFGLEEATACGANFIYTEKFTEIHPGLYLTGEVPRITEYEDVGGNFQKYQEETLVADSIPDDMALIMDHPGGLIIISGCSHSGMVNIMHYARQMTGQSKIQAYIGGTHLIRASQHRLQHTVEAIREFQVEKLLVGHCTGFYAAARLYQELGDVLVKADAGMTFTF